MDTFDNALERSRAQRIAATSDMAFQNLVARFKRANMDYPRQQRLTALFMLILTCSYLVWELSFNARLLDVVGSLESHAKVESIEVWGRLISGTALALILLGSCLSKAAKEGWSTHQYVSRALPTLAICLGAMLAVYFAQKLIIDAIVASSTAEAKRRAAVLVPLTKLIQVGQVEIPSLTLSASDFATPAGKTLLATFPLQALSHPDLFPRLEGAGVERFFEAYARQIRGDADAMHAVYTRSVDALVEQYEGPYRQANTQYQRETGAGLQLRQGQAWKDYANRLRANNTRTTPGNVPRLYWGRVRSDVQRSGVPVPNNWQPSDRGGFNAAIAQRVRKEALESFRMQSRMKLGLTVPLEPGMGQEAFLAHAGVLASWRNALSLSESIRPVANLSLAAFHRDVFPRVIDGDVITLMKTNYAKTKDYERGGRFFKQGEDAFRALVVPPVALIFSLVGAMTHIFKVFAFLANVVVPVGGRVLAGSAAVYLALAMAIPLGMANKVSDQTLFADLEGYTRTHLGAGGAIVAGGIRWAVQFQPIFYPINEFARTGILSSPTFNRSPKDLLLGVPLPSSKPVSTH